MNLPAFGVRRPVTNLMIFLGIILVSLYALTRLGVDMMPEIEPPAISVIASYPGASPEDVESKVTEPLENQLATTPGLEKITSRSMEGAAVITLKFLWGVNLDEASNDIRDRIEMAKRVLPDIPDEMENPFIFKFNTAMMPFLFIGFTADRSYPDLYDLLDKRVGDALRQLPGVGTVQFYGGLRRQINVWVDKTRLESAGFSILDLNTVLARENITQPVGSLKSGLTEYLLRLPGEFASPADIERVILGRRNGSLIYLKDVARVEDGFMEQDTIVRVNGRPGMAMTVQKQIGVNTVEVAKRVKRRLASLTATLPADIRMFVVMDTSQEILDSLGTLRSTVFVAAVLVILVTWFFLQHLRPSLIIALTIPFSLLIAFIYLFLSGKTINVISLSSLTIAIGMVVDNAIVMVDNIMRHLARGERPREASMFGASEMMLSVAASTATTIVVFLPMMFVSGVVGIMFGELAVIVCVTLAASLFTAATFTPMLTSQWLRRPAAPGGAVAPRRGTALGSAVAARTERWLSSWERGYAAALAWSLGHRKTIVLGFSAVFLGSLLLTRFVGNEFIPEEDSGDLSVTVHLPIGTRVEETDRVAARMETIFEEAVPERRVMRVRSGAPRGMGAVFGGASGAHIVSAGIKLVPKTERQRSVQDIAQALRTRIQALPGVLKTDIGTGNPLGRIITGTGGKSIQVEILGHDFAETDRVARDIKAAVERVPGAVDVSISRESRRPELRLTVDREKASALGLNMYTLSQSVRTFIEGTTASRYREKGETYDIVVRLQESDRLRPEDLEALMPVAPYTGKRLALSSLATIEETVGPLEIERQNRQRIVRVECNAHGRSTGRLTEDIERAIAAVPLPSDVTVTLGGEGEEQGKAFRDLTLLLLLGIVLVYMVMAAQFESLLDPFIVMFAVPFTFTGVILAFVLTGTTLSVITFLGLVMLMGIVVNNAIVLISYINILRARGLSMIEAVTLGGHDRLRPVLMTTVTTLAGLLPLALSRGKGSETWQPLGITMIGGLAVSTFVTLLFVPTLYAVFEGRWKRGRGTDSHPGGHRPASCSPAAGGTP